MTFNHFLFYIITMTQHPDIREPLLFGKYCEGVGLITFPIHIRILRRGDAEFQR